MNFIGDATVNGPLEIPDHELVFHGPAKPEAKVETWPGTVFMCAKYPSAWVRFWHRFLLGWKWTALPLMMIFLSSTAQAQWLLKPVGKADNLMNIAFAGSYAAAIADAHSTDRALSNPVRRYRETSPFYNWAIDEHCPCLGKRVALDLGYTIGANALLNWAYRKSGDNKPLKITVIAARIGMTALLIPTIRQNYRNANGR